MLDATCPDLRIAEALTVHPTEDSAGRLVRIDAPGAATGCVFEVPPWAEVLFGRAARSMLGVVDALEGLPPDPRVSRLHASLAVDAQGAYLVDLGSTNGTWLDGRRLAARVPLRLRHRAVFRVGVTEFVWLTPLALVAEPCSASLRPDAFEEFCLSELHAAQLAGGPLSVIVVRERAGLETPWWSALLRSVDVVAPVDTGEWLVVMPRTDAGVAWSVAGQIQAAHARRALSDTAHEGDFQVGVACVTMRRPGAGGPTTPDPSLETFDRLVALARAQSAARRARRLPETGADTRLAAAQAATDPRPIPTPAACEPPPRTALGRLARRLLARVLKRPA